MPNQPLTQTTLNVLNCNDPTCTHEHDDTLTFHARCHPLAPTWTSYTASTGVMEVTCAVCGALVVEVAVERGEPLVGH